MNSNSNIRNYKHDISGKFKDISAAISAMDESAFEDTENIEIFHAVHEVLLKMVKTSMNTIRENLKQEMILVVSDESPVLSLPKLQIEGATVRYEMDNKKIEYFVFLKENTGNTIFLLGRILGSLPVKNIIVNCSDVKLKSEINSLGLGFEVMAQ